MTADRARLQKYIRLALVLQAAGLLAIIALTVPDWLDGLLHPYAGCGLCLDLRGLPFAITGVFLGPVAILLLLTAWRWRGPRRWPLVVVGLIDASALVVMGVVVVSSLSNRSESIPLYASVLPFLLLPALATIALGINLMRPVPLKRILAVSAAGSVLLAAFLRFFAISPVQQSIPGELSLPFGKTAVYESRGLGCVNYVQGWIDMHDCTRATLLIYTGTGDLSKDEAMIERALIAQQRRLPDAAPAENLPVDVSVGSTSNPRVDSSNRGLCLIITDRVRPPPQSFAGLRCGLATDYADIRSHWPANAAYAIGIIYYFEHRDYVSDHSVNFLEAQVIAQAGHNAALLVRADPKTTCSIAVYDASGGQLAGLEHETTDAEGGAGWTWLVDAGTKPGGWPITVTCGSSIGRTSWYVTK